MHCLYGGYNLHRFSDALGLVVSVDSRDLTRSESITFIVFIIIFQMDLRTETANGILRKKPPDAIKNQQAKFSEKFPFYTK